MLMKNIYLFNYIDNFFDVNEKQIAFNKDVSSVVKTSKDIPNYYLIVDDKEAEEHDQMILRFLENNLKYGESIPAFLGAKNFFKTLPHSAFTLSIKILIDQKVLEKDKELGLVTSHEIFVLFKEMKDGSVNVDFFFDFALDEGYLVLYKTVFKNFLSEKVDMSIQEFGFFLTGGALVSVKDQDSIEEFSYRSILSILNLFVEKINQEDLILAKETRSFKIKKKTYRDFNITRVSSKKTFIKDFKENKIPNHLDWQYSWIVRGHWRKESLDFLGKDRDGNRNQIGRTWVSESVKNKGLPFINPLRIVE